MFNPLHYGYGFVCTLTIARVHTGPRGDLSGFSDVLGSSLRGFIFHIWPERTPRLPRFSVG